MDRLIFGRRVSETQILLEAYVHRLKDSARSFAAFALLTATFTFSGGVIDGESKAFAESRTLRLYNTHTHERVEITFKKNGRYVSSALRDLNRFLRDWRRNEITQMDPALFDLIWEVYSKAGTREYIHVVSGYRSPATNNMLRSRSRGVAKQSQHTRGKAMDFFIPGYNLAQLRAIGLRKEVGGVGFYPTSGSPFVHMDTGSVRHWPRMTRSQLAKVFPDGVTIHVPTDGKPMPGYQQALARHKSGGGSKSTVVATSGSRTTGQVARNIPDDGALVRPGGGGSSGKGFLASLFSSDAENAQEDAESGTADAGAAEAAPTNANTPAQARTEQIRVAAVRPDTQTGDTALPGVKSAERSTSAAGATTPVEAPPVPVQKEIAASPEEPTAADDPIVIASVVPRSKPVAPALLASATPARPGTLEAQAQRLSNGQPALERAKYETSEPIQVAALTPPAPERFKPTFDSRPQVKPEAVLALAAAATAETALPRPAPTDGAAAIAAITSGDKARKPVANPALGNAVLAYGAAQPTAASLTTASFNPAGGKASTKKSTAAAQNYARTGTTASTASLLNASATGVPGTGKLPAGKSASKAADASLSGQVPQPAISDPLAQFAALPDRTATPGLLSGESSTNTATFAALSHPNQRKVDDFLSAVEKVVPVRFETAAAMPVSDHFTGSDIVLLPVLSLR